MKYIVAIGASFVAGGISYGPGDEIDSSVFSEDALKRALKPSERFPNGKLLDKAKVDAEKEALRKKEEEVAELAKKNREDRAAREKAERELNQANAQDVASKKAAEKAKPETKEAAAPAEPAEKNYKESKK